MSVTTKQERSAFAVSTTELGLISGTSTLGADTTAGGYQLVLDSTAMAKSDEYQIRAYEKVHSAGTQRKFFQTSLSDTQSRLFYTPVFWLLNGWEFTLQRTGGANCNFDASVRKAGSVSTYHQEQALTVSTTELSLVSGTSTLQTKTDPGVYQLWLDLSALQSGDEFRLRFYEKTLAAGSQKKFTEIPIVGGQSEIWVFPPMELLNGFDFTIQKTAGTDRAIDSSIRKAG
jgi:hypothetical protein